MEPKAPYSYGTWPRPRGSLSVGLRDGVKVGFIVVGEELGDAAVGLRDGSCNSSRMYE